MLSGQGACTFHTMTCIRASWYAINTVILHYLRLSDDQLFVEKRVRANDNKKSNAVLLLTGVSPHKRPVKWKIMYILPVVQLQLSWDSLMFVLYKFDCIYDYLCYCYFAGPDGDYNVQQYIRDATGSYSTVPKLDCLLGVLTCAAILRALLALELF